MKGILQMADESAQNEANQAEKQIRNRSKSLGNSLADSPARSDVQKIRSQRAAGVPVIDAPPVLD